MCIANERRRDHAIAAVELSSLDIHSAVERLIVDGHGLSSRHRQREEHPVGVAFGSSEVFKNNLLVDHETGVVGSTAVYLTVQLETAIDV